MGAAALSVAAVELLAAEPVEVAFAPAELLPDPEPALQIFDGSGVGL